MAQSSTFFGLMLRGSISGDSIDTTTSSGIYKISGGTNSSYPLIKQGSYLIVLNWDANAVYQLVFSYHGTGVTPPTWLYRKKQGAEWGAFFQLNADAWTRLTAAASS